MKKNHPPLYYFSVLILLLIRCTTDAPVIHLPEELFFIPQPLPALDIPIDVGGRTENPEDETGVIRSAFREAYAEALLRDMDLTGVLGSDRVNPWPEAAPESWSQNWASAESFPNSWGIDNLVLALGNFEALAELSELAGKEKAYAYVHSVYGPILDMYGRSAGYNRSNGVVGYGIPLGEAVYSNGTAVQRFSRGRMIIAAEGSRFSYQDDTFASLIENLSQEEMEREFGGRNISREVSNAFIYAWAFFFSEKEGKSDGPLVRVQFSKPWHLDTTEQTITINGFYYKSFNKSQDVLILVESPELPMRTHLLYGPFLSAIQSKKRLSGIETERRLGAAAGKGLAKSLTEGFAVYGPPLSDPLPMPVSKTSSRAAEDSGILFLEAQRFARGWIVAEPIIKSEPYFETEIETETKPEIEEPEIEESEINENEIVIEENEIEENEIPEDSEV